MNTLAALVMLSLLSVNTECYSAGAGPPACTDLNLTPQHPDPSTSTNIQASDNNESPYALSVSSETYTPGETVTVTIASESETFKGFLLVATADGSTVIGSFTTIGDEIKDKTQPRCDSGSNTGLTHTEPLTISELIAEWTAPADLDSDVTFYVTVVKQLDTFYVKLGGLTLTKAETTVAEVTTKAADADTSTAEGDSATTKAQDKTTKAGGSTATYSGLLLTGTMLLNRYLM